MKTEDSLVGRVVGTFKILERRPNSPKGHRLYKCECIECGSLFIKRKSVAVNSNNRCQVCAERKKNPQFEPFEECFGYENGECTALVELVCASKGWCAFYKERDDG